MNGYISKERAEICVMSAIEGSEGDDVLRALDDVRLAINSEPAAHVVPLINGYWREENARPKSFLFVCSVCGKKAHARPSGGLKSWKKSCGLKWCPNCGARMSDGFVRITYKEESGNE